MHTNSKRKNVAFLGAGSIANKVAPMLKQAGFHPYAVGSLSRAKDFALMHGFEKFYENYEGLLQDQNIDLVYINTPHSLHYEHIKMCLENNKNVLCEKSFTLNFKQAKELVELARIKNLLLAEGIWTRYMPYINIIKDFLAKDLIGEIVSIEANLAYNVKHKNRITSLELGGGALLDVGVYTLNFALSFLKSEIKNILATCKKMPSGVDESNGIILEFEQGVFGFLNSSVAMISDRKGVINGTKGYICVDNINNPSLIKVYDKERKLIKECVVPSQINGFEYEFQACFEALEQNKIECDAMNHEEILKMMNLMDRVREKMGVKFIGE
ncbi:Gfo/Idh/MocA family protein [Campylobacter aviculae]|uniref:Gfo/Idh/MocA family oxidoreductase n=1 Tax=Campylobacter aviculae TaxID=2510190 RepID=A0A4U7BL96_9BACT|nr:Gfo/Idh/MocA family oxidoreductase [Campylobacter aviculae]TKX30920.1 gfo/Idh/MocA family oxidoreductase [Campylobacter aviculae]